ncbi:MAG: ankyrin repeat domain-containing protein [Gemmatimonadota bacterium]|nr:ankyrin repeat domain-containing protein [Gemmatimonadota bacterium]
MPDPGLKRAIEAAEKAIHANDTARLERLVAEHPGLLTWHNQDDERGVLLYATISYANFPGAENEAVFNRPDCARLLLDAGAVMHPQVYLRAIDTGAHGMLALFDEKGVLPENLRTLTARGDLEKVQGCFDSAGALSDVGRPQAELRTGYAGAEADWPDPADDQLIVADAFLYACRLGHREIAHFLMGRCLQLDDDLRSRVEAWQGKTAFIDFLLEKRPEGGRNAHSYREVDGEPGLIWRRAVELRLLAALDDGDADSIRDLLAAEPFLLGPRYLETQEMLLSVAACSEGKLPVIEAVITSGAAITTVAEPPASRAIFYALEYGNADYVPALSQIWPVPDDLPHAAGLSNMEAVAKRFANGFPRLGDPSLYVCPPGESPLAGVKEIVDRALAWAVQNGNYEVADYLLDHGANINTRWSTHEPASILHKCAFAGRMEQVVYLVGKGIDLNIRDHRHDGTAEDWARHAGHEEIAEYLAGFKGA